MTPLFLFLAATSLPAQVPDKPNYAQHIAPILNRSCVSCHRPGEVGPMSLVGYENAKKWAPMVARVTQAKQMPPWRAVHGFGEFEDTTLLREPEIETIAKWSRAGAPRGDRKLEPTPPKFASTWILGEPDMLLKATRPYKLAAEGPDVYRNFVIKTNFPEAKWVKAIDVKPGNKKMVHHVIAYLDHRGRAEQLLATSKDGQEGYQVESGGGTDLGFLPDGALGVWAPGLRPTPLPEGAAFRLEPGATIVMQIHYFRTGKEESDQTEVGVYFAKEPIRNEAEFAWHFQYMLNIPPGKADHKVAYRYTFKEDQTVFNVMPHMHLLGRKMKAWFETPEGQTKPLIFIDDWNFNWQMAYQLKKPLRVTKGTKIFIEAEYDNSANNPRNPHSPPQRVTWGEGTKDEMFLLLHASIFEGMIKRTGRFTPVR